MAERPRLGNELQALADAGREILSENRRRFLDDPSLHLPISQQVRTDLFLRGVVLGFGLKWTVKDPEPLTVFGATRETFHSWTNMLVDRSKVGELEDMYVAAKLLGEFFTPKGAKAEARLAREQFGGASYVDLLLEYGPQAAAVIVADAASTHQPVAV